MKKRNLSPPLPAPLSAPSSAGGNFGRRSEKTESRDGGKEMVDNFKCGQIKREGNDLSKKGYLVFASSPNITTEVDLLLCQRPAIGCISIIKDTPMSPLPK